MLFATLTPEQDLEDLAWHIAGLWATASWPGLRRLRVVATEDSIRLEGEVGTFFEKQQAYQWARRLSRGALVEDAIEVLSRHSPT